MLGNAFKLFSTYSKTVKLSYPLSIASVASQASLNVTAKSISPIFSSQEMNIYSASKILEKFFINCEWIHNNRSLFIPTHHRIDRESNPGLDWRSRAPVVTIMGHVDHGKTTLLDYLRKSNVAANEVGGITQHIGAFSVNFLSGSNSCAITFLDTPGHSAFSEMRRRGANATDIVTLVISADDGIMPQTVESIRYAQNANVPILIAINKCDKYEYNSDAILRDLLNYGIQVEELGGDTQAVRISAKTGKNVDLLLDSLIALGEILELKAPTNGPVDGIVLESKLVAGYGPVATLLIRCGTVHPGVSLMSSDAYCRVRKMYNTNSRSMLCACPSEAVEIVGWKHVPIVGSRVVSCGSEQEFESRMKSLASFMKTRACVYSQREDVSRISEAADSSSKSSSENNIKQEELAIVLFGKNLYNSLADVSGSIEALEKVMEELTTTQVCARILRCRVGHPSTDDIDFACLTKSRVVVFGIEPNKMVNTYAQNMKIEIHYFSIIYELVDFINKILTDILPPKYQEKILGKAIVKAIFPIEIGKGKICNAAGCYVSEGSIKKTQGSSNSSIAGYPIFYEVNVIRDGQVVHSSQIKELRHVKEMVLIINKGSECGIMLDPPFESISIGDEIVSICKTPSKSSLSIP